MDAPDKNKSFPLPHYKNLCFLKNIIKNPNIIVGDYTYYDDFEDVENFEKNVKYHFDFTGDKLVIGKFCMIASGVTFIMNGANHLTDAIIATNSTVTKDVAPYSIVGGNPAQEIRKRFSEEKIKKLLELKWWDWEIEKITQNVKMLTGNEIGNIKNL